MALVDQDGLDRPSVVGVALPRVDDETHPPETIALELFDVVRMDGGRPCAGVDLRLHRLEPPLRERDPFSPSDHDGLAGGRSASGGNGNGHAANLLFGRDVADPLRWAAYRDGMQKRAVAATMIATVALVAGCGSDDAASPGERGTLGRRSPRSNTPSRRQESITISAGETIEFVVTNEGSIDHEMEVLTDANRRLGKTERIAPGDSATVVVTFDEAGLYRVICDIDDHRSLGQQAEFTVFEPDDDRLSHRGGKRTSPVHRGATDRTGRSR